MKLVFGISFLFLNICTCLSQFRASADVGDFYNRIKCYNLSEVFNPDSIQDVGPEGMERFKRASPIGFIDTFYERFQIHFNTVRKNRLHPYVYSVTGKTKVGNYICTFRGTITILYAQFTEGSELPQYERGIVLSDVALFQTEQQQGSGFIKGQLTSRVVLDSTGKLYYDALDIVADGYANNTVEGQWINYRTNTIKKCNWGDYRIPDCGDLDGGVSEFIPNEKYIHFGWENYFNALFGFVDDPKRLEAVRLEEVEWWK